MLAVIITGGACGIDTGSRLESSPEVEEASAPTLPANTIEAPIERQATYSIGATSAGSGLEQLRSYRANLTVDFLGDRNGESANGHIESLKEINQATNALHQYLIVDANMPDTQNAAGIYEFFQIGGSVYIIRPDETLFFSTDRDNEILPGEMGFYELDRLIMLPSVVSSPPQTETIQGLNVKHYSFTQDDLDIPNIIFEQAQGEVWVVEPGNYVIQYTLSGTVKILTPIPNAHLLDEGTLKLNYMLTDINTAIDIMPPDNIETAITPLADLPRPPDSEIIAVFPALLEYTSVISPISATLFYKNGLPVQGWTEENAEVFEEKSQLVYVKEDNTLTIIITPDDHQDKVKVSLNLDTQP